MGRFDYVSPLRLIFLMWLSFAIELFMGIDLGWMGIYPRDLFGVLGIFTAPMVHGNFNHLISNSLPLLVLGGMLYTFYPLKANRVFFQGYFFTNLLVWTFARPFYHIGASGLVYAIASFLIAFGFFKRDFKSVLVSLLVILFYGGMVYGLFPLNDRISWESHLMGAIVGGMNGFLLSRKA